MPRGGAIPTRSHLLRSTRRSGRRHGAGLFRGRRATCAPGNLPGNLLQRGAARRAGYLSLRRQVSRCSRSGCCVGCPSNSRSHRPLRCPLPPKPRRRAITRRGNPRPCPLRRARIASRWRTSLPAQCAKGPRRRRRLRRISPHNRSKCSPRPRRNGASLPRCRHRRVLAQRPRNRRTPGRGRSRTRTGDGKRHECPIGCATGHYGAAAGRGDCAAPRSRAPRRCRRGTARAAQDRPACRRAATAGIAVVGRNRARLNSTTSQGQADTERDKEPSGQAREHAAEPSTRQQCLAR